MLRRDRVASLCDESGNSCDERTTLRFSVAVNCCRNKWREIAQDDYLWRSLCAKRWPSCCKQTSPSTGFYYKLFQSFNKRQILPPGVSDMLSFLPENAEFRMVLPVEPSFIVTLSQAIIVSVLVGRKDSNKIACIINKSIFDYIDRTANRAIAFDYLDFTPALPFVSGIRAWISLLLMDNGTEGINMDVFRIEMDFCDAANSEEEVLWLLDALDWK
ncbi:hypothetical protein F0562_004351 [Nyssa sinensis]|uniref:F-box domain-containing protein n=1 Tax=Nyssa sinensis TaxID=561372 RepID=A0A5J5C1V4_9ASTE|nr:hypothetical protein F0562_004351 [Nyssa sinensis]